MEASKADIQDTSRANTLLVRAIIASQFAPPFMFSGVAVALPTMGADLGAGAIALSLVETLFLAGSLAFLLPIGKLADLGDKRTLYKIGLLGFGLSSLLIGFMPSMTVILVLRLMQGITSSIFATTGPAILAEIVPPQQRSRAYGASIGVMYAGLSLGPVCAGMLVDLISWRAVFLFGGSILVAGFIFISRKMPSRWRKPIRPVHLPSSVLVVIAVLLVVAGSAVVSVHWISWVFMAAGGLLGGIFIWTQRGMTDPLINIDAIMSHRLLRSALVVQLLVYTSAFASTFLFSLYLQVSLDKTAREAGLMLAVSALLMAITAPLAGRLGEKLRPVTIATFGVGCVMTAAIGASLLGAHSPLWVVGLLLATQGVGYAMFTTPNMTIIMNSVAENETSMASAMAGKSRSIGIVGGMVIVAVLISQAVGNDEIKHHPEALIRVLKTAFTIFTMTSATALVLSFLPGRRIDHTQ